MSSVPSAFNHLRTSYNGAEDRISDVDVDIVRGRVYAASFSGEVLIWDLETQKLHVILRHPHWVNAVRCYPRCSASQPMPTNTSVKASEADRARRNSTAAQWILTGCEDGVVSAWCPVTYRILQALRPGHGPIVHLHLPASVAAKDVCCAVSLSQIFIIKLSAPQWTISNILKHPAACTAVASLLSLSNAGVLLVGQEDGSIRVWNMEDWSYSYSLMYPSNERDIDEDAKLPVVKMPTLSAAGVSGTFQYNLRRCADPKRLGFAGADLTEAAAAEMYRATMPGGLSKRAGEVARQHFGPLPTAYWSNTPNEVSEEEKEEVLPSLLEYDRRRVTCLSVSQYHEALTSRFFSGHATGEILLWAALRKEVPILLLKKIPLFPANTWVWHMCALDGKEVLHPSVSHRLSGEERRKTMRSSAKRRSSSKSNDNLGSVTRQSTSFGGSSVFGQGRLEVLVWGDSGSVKYIGAKKDILVLDGPGFLSTAACCWSSPTLPVAGNTSIEASGTSGGRAHVVMGNFEGRMEQFDITELFLSSTK